MEVTAAHCPNANVGVPRLNPGRPVARKALEVLLEDEHVGPPGPQHCLADIDAVGAIDVEERASELVDGVLRGVADERDLLALDELPHRLRCLFSTALDRYARLQRL